MTTCIGVFNDGETARRHSVTLKLEPTTLLIVNDEGGVQIRWPFTDLRVAGEAFDGHAIRLKYGDAGLGRLTVDNAGFLDAIHQAAPHLRDNPNLNWKQIGRLAGGVALIGAILYFSFPRLLDLAVDLVPTAWEQSVGEKLIGDVAAQMGAGEGFCSNPDGVSALARLTTRLTSAAAAVDRNASNADKAFMKIVVHAANARQNNAFTVLGGQILVLDGLLSGAQSPDEVAGVLAHEIGHILHRHPVRSLARAIGFNFIAELAFGENGAASLGHFLVSRSYSRQAEQEADATALMILDEAKISPSGLADFLERLNDSGVDWLSTHPDSKTRAAAIRAHKGPDATSPALSPAAWRDLKGVCKPSSKSQPSSKGRASSKDWASPKDRASSKDLALAKDRPSFSS